MRAAQFAKPGPAAVIQLAQIPRPMCCETTQVLIKVGTGSLNPVDFKQRRNPTLEYMRPLPAVSGFDFSGKVEQIGAGVLGFRPGDTVYGMLPLQGQSWGAFQEYVVTNYTIIAHVPSKISPKEAAGLPLVGLTVVQALAPVLRTWQRNGESSKGKKILIHAGAGGVGSFAIQYCKNVPFDMQKNLLAWGTPRVLKLKERTQSTGWACTWPPPRAPPRRSWSRVAELHQAYYTPQESGCAASRAKFQLATAEVLALTKSSTIGRPSSKMC